MIDPERPITDAEYIGDLKAANILMTLFLIDNELMGQYNKYSYEKLQRMKLQLPDEDKNGE